ncbi:MAG: hypothetical protein ACOVSW_09700, partial [Candidatus Kapaibacteriota bacterium]
MDISYNQQRINMKETANIRKNIGFVQSHIDCPCGEHKDNAALRPDGSTWCFSCLKNFYAKDFLNAPQPILPCSFVV